MIDLVTKFISWIKDAVTMIVTLPSQFAGFLSVMSTALSWLPNGLGSIISGLIMTAVIFVVVYAIVKLVASLL